MKFRRLLLWFYHLSWKKLIGFSTLALSIAVIPLVFELANTRTRTRSDAALITKPQPVTTEFVTPKGPPEVYLVDHFFGKSGDAVLVHGSNLGGASTNTQLLINGQVVPEENLVTWTGDYIEFKLPNWAKSGIVGVNILGQTANWPGKFWVVNSETAAEIRLEKISELEANLMAKNIDARQGLLVWLLIYQGEGNLQIKPAVNVGFQETTKTTPLGKVYELKFTFPQNNGWTNLATVTKKDGLAVGVARAETGTDQPIKSHPLYVSF